jgi:hypothetical protein
MEAQLENVVVLGDRLRVPPTLRMKSGLGILPAGALVTRPGEHEQRRSVGWAQAAAALPSPPPGSRDGCPTIGGGTG